MDVPGYFYPPTTPATQPTAAAQARAAALGRKKKRELPSWMEVQQQAQAQATPPMQTKPSWLSGWVQRLTNQPSTFQGAINAVRGTPTYEAKIQYSAPIGPTVTGGRLPAYRLPHPDLPGTQPPTDARFSGTPTPHRGMGSSLNNPYFWKLFTMLPPPAAQPAPTSGGGYYYGRGGGGGRRGGYPTRRGGGGGSPYRTGGQGFLANWNI